MGLISPAISWVGQLLILMHNKGKLQNIVLMTLCVAMALYWLVDPPHTQCT